MSHPSMIRGALACSLLGFGLNAAAQTPALFKDADLKLGEKLIAQHKCNQCHAQKWTDDGKAIYRPKGRVNIVIDAPICGTSARRTACSRFGPP